MKNKLIHNFLSIQEDKRIVFYVVIDFDDYQYHHGEFYGGISLITLSEEKAYNARKVYSADISNPNYWERDTSARSELPYKIEIFINKNDEIEINCDKIVYEFDIFKLIPFNDIEFMNKYNLNFIYHKKQLDFLSNFTNVKYIYLGLDKDTIDLLTNKLSNSEKENVVELQIRYANFLDIEILNPFKCIQYLDLESNNIDDISNLKNKNKIKYLNLNLNKIKDLTPLQDFQNLEYLNLANNNITDITPLRKLQNLKYLNLSQNKIDNFQFFLDLPNLKHLDISGNSIRNISGITFLNNLEYLNASYNKIYDIEPLTKLNKIKYLILNNNIIDFIHPFNQLFSLKHLELMSNEIENAKDFGRDGLINLEVLKMDNNFLTKLPDLSRLNKLQYCSVTRNFISSQIKLPKSINIIDFHKTLFLHKDIEIKYPSENDFRTLKERLIYKYETTINEKNIIYLKT